MPEGSGSNTAPTTFERLLREVAHEGETLPDPTADPGPAFRRLYEGWVERGGYERGKQRHSARKIKSWLGEKTVRSFETKIAGRTWLQRQDAEQLLHLFLSRWSYHDADQTYDAYPTGSLSGMIEDLLDDLFNDEHRAILLPERTRGAPKNSATPLKHSAAAVSSVDLSLSKPSRDIIRELFRESDVLFTISRERTVIGQDPADSMKRFHSVLAELYEIDHEDSRERALIWIVDIGLRDSKPNASLTFINLESLATQFRAIRIFDTSPNKSLSHWLAENVVILVGSLRRAEIDRCYSQAGVNDIKREEDLQWFFGDRLFLEAVPGRWLKPAEMRRAFGQDVDDLWERPTITAHFSFGGWGTMSDLNIDDKYDLRYLFHVAVSTFANSTTDEEMGGARCLELGQPGVRWSDSFRLASDAAFERLNRRDQVRNFERGEAIGQLRRQNFAVLRLKEFMNLTNILVGAV